MQGYPWDKEDEGLFVPRLVYGYKWDKDEEDLIVPRKVSRYKWDREDTEEDVMIAKVKKDSLQQDEAEYFDEICKNTFDEKDKDNRTEENEADMPSETAIPVVDKQKNTDKNIVKSTDQYNMHTLEKILLSNLTIVNLHDKLYYYTGKIYAPIDKATFMKLMRISLPENVVVSVPSYSKFEEVYKYMCCNPDIELKVSDRMKKYASHLIVFQNGVYNVWDGSLQDFSRRFPVFFDIDAEYVEDYDTPNFDKFMRNVTQGNKSIETLLLQMLGYLMMQSTDAKCFFVLGTEANSGKSLWGEFICNLFPEDMVGTIPLTELGGRFALGRLWKHAINVSMDLPTRTFSEEEVSQLKMLTGERRIRTEEKYEPVTTSYIHCKHVFATNGMLALKVPDEAFWDRVVFVPFMNSIPREKQDKRLLEKLLEEKNGIVSKAARAAKDLMINNYIFNMPAESYRILEEWKYCTSDSITNFLDKKCIFNEEYQIFSEDLYSAYKSYCAAKEITPETQTALSRKVNKLSGVTSYKKRRDNNENPVACFCGIGLKDE